MAFYKGYVIIIGAGWAGQDPHKVTVITQILQQTGHLPVQKTQGQNNNNSPHKVN